MNRPDINPATGFLRQARFFPAQPALVYEGQEFNNAALVERMGKAAKALAAAGVKRGDRVAYLGLNSSTFLVSMMSAWWVGAVFEPLNFRLAPREVQGLLERSTPAVLVVEPCHQDVIEAIDADLGSTRLILVDNDPAIPARESIDARWTPLSQFIAAGSDTELPDVAPATDEDLAVLMFTSGTTGKPKGVQLTYGNLWWNSVNVDSLVDTRRGDVNLAVAPLFHIGALNALTIRVMVRGGVNVVRRNFDPRQTLKDIEQYQVSQAFLVPAQLSAMQQTEEFGRHDISSLRALICAGAPVPPVLLKQYESEGVAVQQAWGLTETSPFATYLPSELTHVKAGSCGIPMPYTEVRIVDPVTLRDVESPGERGEMWVKGPNVTPGYWNDPDATESAFEDGWFRTGDIGYKDEDGYLFIVDRLKDMIITGGENVYPAEVERALMEYPGVTDVAVVGVEDPKWGESVVAVMSFRGESIPTIEEVREFSASYLARYKLPKKLVLVNSVPRNGSGKLDKHSIRQLANQEG
ncbi:long-chain fatty acid--CoA ligase [Pseudarthrobacter sp. J75]|uniref:acyl-CoA synthetase n=1 Tax=unclassified Pseudarthrobacter TaxID=2647000 RepID=UPI002E7FDDAF|nr:MULTISPECIES: long-chain fatty acid--CoA ligase [unclassified Pseudarthrobacter]MEE2523644.1 long-chain fatty acid--CoA ligase [Pseudarthrobacter sp. J47]MEE2530034.1 long-chain fatty acid--CoA ligase [Pseudarthrobacter sp. J75]